MLFVRSEIRTVVENNPPFGYTVAALSDGHILYRSDLHLDVKSARGFLIDLRNALNNAACLWCGEPAGLIHEVDELNVYAFDTEQCWTEAMRAAAV